MMLQSMYNKTLTSLSRNVPNMYVLKLTIKRRRKEYFVQMA